MRACVRLCTHLIKDGTLFSLITVNMLVVQRPCCLAAGPVILPLLRAFCIPDVVLPEA